MTKVIHLPSPRAGKTVHTSAQKTTPPATTPTPGNPSTGNAPKITAAQTAFGQMLHKRLAAPTWGTPIDPAARQAAIENHLSMALWHVMQGNCPLSTQAATGRAVRAATLLKLQCDETTNGGRA